MSSAALLASLLYLVPILAVWVFRAHQDRPLWEIALDVPLAVALDLCAVLVLSRALPLEIAAIVARVLWLALLAARLWGCKALSARLPWLDWPAPAWPRALGRPEVALGLTAAACGALLSMWFSRSCHNFDRGWHMALVPSLRGQTLPFANVYEPGHPLGYHFSGDVLAACLQTYSGVSLHSSYALSLAHDLMFALSALSGALLLRWLGMRSLVPTLLASLAPLLASPMTLLGPEKRGTQGWGYSFLSFLKLSYRPHTVLAALLMVGFVGALLVALRCGPERPSGWRTALVLVATTALLAVTDESSIGVLGLALGVSWLFVPQLLHPRRRAGLGMLAALFVALVGASLLFHGALMAGAGEAIAWVPLRLPGYRHPPLSFGESKALEELSWDILPTVALCFAGLAGLWRRFTRERVGALVFLVVLVALSLVLLTHVDVGQRSLESHRFFTAALFCAPLVGLSWLADPAGERPPTWALSQSLVVVAVCLGAVSSLDWLTRNDAPGERDCWSSATFFARSDLFHVDCRREAGARLGQRPVPVYLDKRFAYLLAGCRPVYTSGPPPAPRCSDRLDLDRHEHVTAWNVRIGTLMQVGRAALADLNDRLAPPGSPLVLMCEHASDDPYCRRAHDLGVKCRSFAGALERCELPRRDYPRLEPDRAPPRKPKVEPCRPPRKASAETRESSTEKMEDASGHEDSD